MEKTIHRKIGKASSPFRSSSVIGKVWIAALEGTNLRRIAAICAKEGGADSARMLRILRKCSYPSKKIAWNVDEGAKGAFRVYNVRPM